MKDFFRQERRGETELGDRATWRERRKPVVRDLKQEVEEDQNSNTRCRKQERNVDPASTVQQEEEGGNTDKLKDEAERTANTVEPEEAAEEWFEADWWLPPKRPLPSATAQESCG
ncbi:hypothetical protein NDU88_000318 [Pleurodeles waltl]|uniref:Uncharacterized protein n=1 Tax=Pleurodeles waltl TaxID=8319 RepID=A0AAV7VW91_PLEWA|nr:hypothetical protein NDU88_000318 [Pleurodeles waltl]